MNGRPLKGNLRESIFWLLMIIIIIIIIRAYIALKSALLALYRYTITRVIGFRLACTQCMHIFHSDDQNDRQTTILHQGGVS